MDAQEHVGLTKAMQVNGYPTLIWSHRGLWLRYEGEMTESGIRAFVKTRLDVMPVELDGKGLGNLERQVTDCASTTSKQAICAKSVWPIDSTGQDPRAMQTNKRAKGIRGKLIAKQYLRT